MLVRDAQEEARVVYTARKDLSKGKGDLLLSHISEVIDVLKLLKESKKSTWAQVSTSTERTIGLLLLVALGVANEMHVDSLEALKSVLLKESP